MNHFSPHLFRNLKYIRPVHPKHLLLIGIIISLSLILIATAVYPGGSQASATTTGFDWKQNYLCNLFAPTAVNGAPNTARVWAITGWFIFCASLAYFFVDFSKKISPAAQAAVPTASPNPAAAPAPAPARTPGPARIIRYCGILGMLSAFLATTPLHDPAITAALIFTMISTLYIVIIVLTSKFTAFKILGILAMIIAYSAAAVYYTRFHLEILPTLQKATLAAFLIFFLCLYYFTTREDFPPPRRKSTPPSNY